MASSALAICNMALFRIGNNQRIESLTAAGDDDDNASVEACNAFYGTARDIALERAPWPFNTRRLMLSAYSADAWDEATTYGAGDTAELDDVTYRSLLAANTGNSPDESPSYWLMLNDERWAYAYPLPADALIVWRVGLSVRMPASDQQPAFDVKADFDADGEASSLILLTDEEDALVEYGARVTNAAVFSASFASAAAFRLAEDLALAIRKDHALAVRMAQAFEAEIGRAWVTAKSGTNPGAEPDAPHIRARG